MFNYDWFSSNVLAFTTDSLSDFSYTESFPLLSQEQKDTLSPIVGDTVDQLISPKQVHKNDVVIVQKETSPMLFEADGLITNLANVPIAVRTADCLPIFLYAPKHQVVGIVHAGWKSTKDHIAAQALMQLQHQWSVNLEDVYVGFGPCLHEGSYEVTHEFVDHFPKDTNNREGKYYFDLRQANRHQLYACGIKKENIFDVNVDTLTSKECHSFRRDGDQSGRMLSVIMMK